MKIQLEGDLSFSDYKQIPSFGFAVLGAISYYFSSSNQISGSYTEGSGFNYSLGADDKQYFYSTLADQLNWIPPYFSTGITQ